MLDKKSKILLEFLRNRAGGSISFYEDIEYPKEFASFHEVYVTFQQLLKEGYVQESRKTKSGTPTRIKITHKGQIAKDLDRKEKRKRLGLYIKKHWIDLILCACAVVSALISLLHF